MAQRELSPNSDTTQRQSVVRPEAQIRLLFEKFQAFVDEYRPKISLGGVFIATSQPKPVGTAIACEFRLADGFRLCQALGEVLWARPLATAPDRPAGMGIRFSAIDDDGRKLILKILEEQVKTGGEPFEVERVPADAEGSGAPLIPAPGDDPAATHRRSVPMPQEDPASTYSRPAVASGPRPGEGLAPIEAPSGGPGTAAGEASFDAVQPVNDFGVEPLAPAEQADFNAPWGVELPGIPEDVIEPVNEEAVMTSLGEEFTTDSGQAGFDAADEGGLFDLEAPSADEEGADLFGLPDFEVTEEEPVADSAEWAPEDLPPEPAGGEELLAGLPDVDEPLESEAGPGPSLAGLDDTLPRSLPDDGRELGMSLPTPRAAPTAGQAPAPAGEAQPAGPFELMPALPDVDEPLDSLEGEMAGGASPAQDRLHFASGLDDDPAADPASGFGTDPPQGGLDPPQGGLDPPQGGSYPPQGGLGLDPPQGGLDPPQGGLDPPQGGLDPPQGGLDPPQEGSYPPHGLNLDDLDSGEDSWWSSDADDEWDDDAESGMKSFLRDFRITVSESKGRILAVVALLVIVGAVLVFREQVLALVGLGSQAVPTPPASAAATPAGGGEGPAAEAGGDTVLEGAPAQDSDDAGSPVPAGEASSPGGNGGSQQADSPPEETKPPRTAPTRRAPPPASRAPAASAPAASAPAASGSAAAKTVRSIECEQTARGTSCVVELDGPFAPDRFEHHPLGYDPLKEQVVLLGIEAPYHSQRIEVGTLELDRIRTGLDADRLKLVFDLSSERMTLSSFEPRAGRLEILVSRRR